MMFAPHLRRTAPLVLLLALAGCSGGVDKGRYVARNNAIFRTVPPYPGATLSNSDSFGIPKGGVLQENGPPYKAFVTRRFYALSAPTPVAQVLRYYHRVLHAWIWRGPITYNGIAPCEATFRKGHALLYINVCPRTQDATSILIDIDHDAYR